MASIINMSLSSLKFWCYLALLLLWTAPATASSDYYLQVCPAGKTVELVLNHTNGVYEYQEPSNETALASSNSTSFRECDCPQSINRSEMVCPIDTRLCGVPRERGEPILCFKEDASIKVVRNVS